MYVHFGTLINCFYNLQTAKNKIYIDVQKVNEPISKMPLKYFQTNVCTMNDELISSYKFKYYFIHLVKLNIYNCVRIYGPLRN